MNMCETINRRTNARRFFIDGKRVSRDAFSSAETAGRMRGDQFHSFNLQCTETVIRHLKCVDAQRAGGVQ